MKGTVSVIIPVYHSSYLREALASVFSQTYRPWEIVLVDSSPESTLPQIQEYLGRIKYVYAEPRGVSAARNVGIKASTGDFVALLDADDLWTAGKLQVQVKAFQEFPQAGFSFSTVWNLVSGDDTHIPQEPFNPPALLEWIEKGQRGSCAIFGSVYDLLLKVNCVATSSLVIRRDIFEHIGFFDESFSNAEDYDFELRVSKHTPAVFVYEPMCRYRIHGSGLSGAWNERTRLFYETNIQVLHKHLREYPSKDLKAALARAYAGYGVSFLRSGVREHAADAAKKSLRFGVTVRALKVYGEARVPGPYATLSQIFRSFRKLAGAEN
jgi:glycosyltransferase involved in cell wall biosynthesis